MCGRFTFQPTEEFYQRFQVINRLDSLVARYNIAPGQMVPVIISQSPNQIMLMRRGLILHWAKAIMNRGDTAMAAQFHRLTTRLGQRRALVAVGHNILVMAWHWPSKHASYQELGRDDFDRCDAHAYRLKLIRQLEAWGLNVAVEPTTSVSEASSFS